MSGRCVLVGAGPGDPGLITVRGLEAIRAADVIVADRLGTEALLAERKPGAVVIDAGKAPGKVAMNQDEINRTLVEQVRAGRLVVRLKGGDPFVFGRGGEELEALNAAGLAAEVVPGITSAIGGPAYAGIPVTHRGVATSFTVVTGHEDPTKPSEQTDWAALARVPGTLVILMGMGRLAEIAATLTAAGRPAEQPAAVVQWATTPRHRSVVATLGTIADAATAAGLGSPSVVVVGEVAGLGLAWLADARPLLGQRIVVTRARAQASGLRDELEALGAEVVELPAIRIAPVGESPEITRAIQDMAAGAYAWIVMTSANGVTCLFDRLADAGMDARAVSPATRVAAIGPGTAAALAARGIRADVVPERFIAEGLLDALAPVELAGQRVLLARAREARDVLPEGLRARGANVDEVPLYDTLTEVPAAGDIERALGGDWVTFTASSTVTRLLELLGDGARDRLAGLRVASIGPVTTSTARAAGLDVEVEATEHTIRGLIEALVGAVRRVGLDGVARRT